MERRFSHTFTATRGILLAGVILACALPLAAAPLERGFDAAPGVFASQAERDAAYWDARFKVLAIAGKYERTPYRYGGADRSGIDCSGLVYVSFKEALSVTIPRSAKGLYTWSEKISVDMLQPGDLVFFSTDNTGTVSHVGLYAGGDRFIHSASAGTKTGVIYSGMAESYWARTFYGAGRALPGSDSFAGHSPPNRGPAAATETAAGETAKEKITKPKNTAAGSSDRFTMGIAVAPTWNAFLSDGNIIRGFAGQIRLGMETFKKPMIFGLELRPEWDGALGVFRVPLTLSWGPNDKWRIFAGPVVSFGDPVLERENGNRHYKGGTTWFGAVGFTAAPFLIPISNGQLAPYAEIAWQGYYINSSYRDPGADFAARFRLSTGLRYTWKL